MHEALLIFHAGGSLDSSHPDHRSRAPGSELDAGAAAGSPPWQPPQDDPPAVSRAPGVPIAEYLGIGGADYSEPADPGRNGATPQQQPPTGSGSGGSSRGSSSDADVDGSPQQQPQSAPPPPDQPQPVLQSRQPDQLPDRQTEPAQRLQQWPEVVADLDQQQQPRKLTMAEQFELEYGQPAVADQPPPRSTQRWSRVEEEQYGSDGYGDPSLERGPGYYYEGSDAPPAGSGGGGGGGGGSAAGYQPGFRERGSAAAARPLPPPPGAFAAGTRPSADQNSGRPLVPEDSYIGEQANNPGYYYEGAVAQRGGGRRRGGGDRQPGSSAPAAAGERQQAPPPAAPAQGARQVGGAPGSSTDGAATETWRPADPDSPLEDLPFAGGDGATRAEAHPAGAADDTPGATSTVATSTQALASLSEKLLPRKSHSQASLHLIRRRC